jgi:hypothetical protein
LIARSSIFTSDDLGKSCVANNHRQFLIVAVENSLTSQNGKPLRNVGDTQTYTCKIGYLPHLWQIDLLTSLGHINLRTDVTVKVVSQKLIKDTRGKLLAVMTTVQFTSWRTCLDDDYDFNDNYWPVVWSLPYISGAELNRIQSHGYARTFNCTSDVVNFTGAWFSGNYTSSTIPK